MTFTHSDVGNNLLVQLPIHNVTRPLFLRSRILGVRLISTGLIWEIVTWSKLHESSCKRIRECSSNLIGCATFLILGQLMQDVNRLLSALYWGLLLVKVLICTRVVDQNKNNVWPFFKGFCNGVLMLSPWKDGHTLIHITMDPTTHDKP